MSEVRVFVCWYWRRMTLLRLLLPLFRWKRKKVFCLQYQYQLIFNISVSNISNTLQHTATHCNTLQRTTTHYNAMQRTATHCNALQRTATHCSALQRTAAHCNALHRTTPHYTALHHTTPHYTALQHTHGNLTRSQHVSGEGEGEEESCLRWRRFLKKKVFLKKRPLRWGSADIGEWYWRVWSWRLLGSLYISNIGESMIWYYQSLSYQYY